MTTGFTEHKDKAYGDWVETAEYAQNSIEVSLTAAGKVTFSVKIYSVDPDEARAMAVTQFAALQERFYPAAGHTERIANMIAQAIGEEEKKAAKDAPKESA